MRKRNIIKIIIGIIIAQYAVNLFFVLVAYRSGNGGTPAGPAGPENIHISNMLVQEIVLTSIVVGLATVVVLTALAMRLYEKYKTFDITKIKDLAG